MPTSSAIDFDRMRMGDSPTYSRANPLLKNTVRYLAIILEQVASFGHRALDAILNIATKTPGEFLDIMSGMHEGIS